MSLLIASLANISQQAKTAAEDKENGETSDFKENQAQVEAGQDPSKKNDGDTKDEQAAEEKKEEKEDKDTKEAGLSIARRMGKIAGSSLRDTRAKNFTQVKEAVLKTAAAQSAGLSREEKEIVGCALNATLTKIACEVDFVDVKPDQATVNLIVKRASEMADEFIGNFTKPRE